MADGELHGAGCMRVNVLIVAAWMGHDERQFFLRCCHQFIALADGNPRGPPTGTQGTEVNALWILVSCQVRPSRAYVLFSS
jgi:hypothetical protein